MLELGIYKHYKGKIYEVIGVANHSETLEKMVVYKATYMPHTENLWVRPLSMFTQMVNVNGIDVKRFEKI